MNKTIMTLVALAGVGVAIYVLYPIAMPRVKALIGGAF